MEEGYDATNLARCRALIAGEPLALLPREAFQLSRRTAETAPAADDVERVPKGGRRTKTRPSTPAARRLAS
jgi:hypothetical protein